MKKDQSNSQKLYQNTILGQLKLNLHPKEIILLKLRYAQKQEIMKLWTELWEGIQDYDHLPAGCRALMPSVVRKLEYMELYEDWKHVHGLDLTFLVGLQRYVWTKNKYLLNQTLRIAEHVGRSGIEVVAIKGMAELLSDTEMGIMRSTSDLDLLIKPKDLDLFKKKMYEIGYEQIIQSEGILDKRSVLPKDQFVFRPKEGSGLELDVHLMVNKYQVNDRLTELVWIGKVPSKQCPTLFVPSIKERFCIALVNAFRITNWYSGSYLKYLNDALSDIQSIDQENKHEFLFIGCESLNLQDWQQQIIQLGMDVGIVDEIMMKRFGLNQTLVSNTVLKSVANSNSISLRDYINRWLTKKLSPEKSLDFYLLLNLYSQVWQSRHRAEVSSKAMKFLLTDPLLQLNSFIGRRFRSLYVWKDKHPSLKKKFPHTPMGNLKWN
jgi:hypothetical protein